MTSLADRLKEALAQHEAITTAAQQAADKVYGDTEQQPKGPNP